MRRRRRIPPVLMHGCGHTERSWTYKERCSACVRLRVDVKRDESLREFRRRVIDPERNG